MSEACKQRNRVEVREVFPLDAAFRISRLNRFHELIDKRVVIIPANAILTKAEIEGVIDKGSVVRAHIKHDRQAVLGRNARASCI